MTPTQTLTASRVALSLPGKGGATVQVQAEIGAAAVVGRAHAEECTGYERCDGYVAEESCPCGCHLREEVYASTAA